MRKALRAIRFSSVGVFFTGIIGVIQGCSVEREGALFAVLLFLLNFCSGPVTEEAPTAAKILLDPFTTAQSFTDSCSADEDDDQIFSDSTLGPLVGITAFKRRINIDSTTSGGDITHTIGSGVASVSSTAVCNQGTFAGIIYFQQSPLIDGEIDLSAFSEIIWPVINVTGTITGCRVRTATLIVDISVQVGITPVAGTDIVLDITAAGNNAVRRITFTDCAFSAGASLTLGPVEVK